MKCETCYFTLTPAFCQVRCVVWGTLICNVSFWELGMTLRDTNKIMSGIHHFVRNMCVGTTMASMEGQNWTRQSVNCFFSDPISIFQVSLAACVFFLFFSIWYFFNYVTTLPAENYVGIIISKNGYTWKTDPSCKRLFRRISSCSKDLKSQICCFFFFVKMLLKLSELCLHAFWFITAVPPPFPERWTVGNKMSPDSKITHCTHVDTFK